jgi:hypothetical protein
MRNNKILAAAIASVVSLGGGVALLSSGSAFAADLFSHGGSGGTAPKSGTAPKFATQLFTGATNIATTTGAPIGTAVAASCGNDSFRIRYKLPLTINVPKDDTLMVKAELSTTLAGWGNAINPTTLVQFCTGNDPTVGSDCPIAGLVVISKSSPVADKGSSTVEFALQVTAASIVAASAYFYFCPDIDAVKLLAEEGANLSLTLSTKATTSQGGLSTVGSPETLAIATSGPGFSVLIDDGKTSVTNPVPPAEAFISFASDSLKFATGATKATVTDIDRVSLGRVRIQSLTDVTERDGSATFSPNFIGWSGKLTIIDGVFSASTGANQVFLDDDGNCVFDTATGSVAATSVTNTVAEWTTLSNTTLTQLMVDPGMHVCVIADGVKAIEEQTRAPTATLELGTAGNLVKYPPGRLRYIKENGTKCTLFNIPDGTETLAPTLSTDVVSVRITNNGATEGTLYATLYDQRGNQIYTPNKRQAIGTIAPFATVRYYTGQESMAGYDPAFDLTTYGSAQHWVGQRATLIIATELSDISVFDLVRNRNSAPNMNMSTGATGNGCD